MSPHLNDGVDQQINDDMQNEDMGPQINDDVGQ